MQDLTVQIVDGHSVMILKMAINKIYAFFSRLRTDNANSADARRSQINRNWTSKSTGPNNQNGCVTEPFLI
jgi:hypothetical protein